ncbi:GDSL/SGNH-like acyl-esterase family found in Pmr5 and Cas1p-domain-containing protein [Radiomyces spectabilis]|uniref:GDSL/SGNH-like acyl-esterase family found in Pmr5 and Cas1p-domain-containing protein n=1 Tax=Radiomyces spectabilis TaxID=64574 RepID=UPI00221FFB75|nr:GDSL/SGNH-like acyl-esterase family found in Pmr5 and Cas1p-domain-containing protein [Radiomyces spectabilis]KAI8391783.1 GDSL/SGNH-like acyl-esterase family found in Pmr5 and Cas1p-domain-containing protein [Radiomyces spectabilis]
MAATKSSTSTLHPRFIAVLLLSLCLLFWLFLWLWQDDARMLLPSRLSLSSADTSNEPSINPPVAASSNSNTSTLCNPETFNIGKWVHHPLHLKQNTIKSFEQATGYHCRQRFAHKCYARSDNREFTRSIHIMDYQWQPSECETLPMEPSAFVDHLQKHALLFVGDSITQLQYESLHCLLGRYVTPAKVDDNLSGGDSHIKIDKLVSNRGPSTPADKPAVAFLRSDYLIRLDDFKMIGPFEDEGDQMGRGHNFPWVHALNMFDYIVINTGPHWHPNLKWGPHRSDEEMLESFEKAMAVVFDYLKVHVQPHQRIWVRSTPYGHAKCSQYTSPQKTAVAPTGQPGEYEWHIFKAFDRVWKEWITKEQDERFQFLNVSLSNTRGDTHSRPDKDCLHTCIPGPVDEWNRLLYHEIAKSQLPSS